MLRKEYRNSFIQHVQIDQLITVAWPFHLLYWQIVGYQQNLPFSGVRAGFRMAAPRSTTSSLYICEVLRMLKIFVFYQSNLVNFSTFIVS